MHDGMHGAAGVPSSMMHAPASAGLHDMAGMARAEGHAGSTPRSGRPAVAHVCTCLGACCAAVAVLPSGPAAISVVSVGRAAVVFTGRPEHEYVAAWVDFVLPFATAPPSQG